MKTVNNELQTIATIMNKNLTTTILTLHNLGFDFTKSVGEQDGEVDEKLSQMLFNSLIATPNAQEAIQQEEITQQPIEKDEKFFEYKRKYDEKMEDEMKRVIKEIETTRIHHKKYKKGETQTKRDWLTKTIQHSSYGVYDRDKFFENSKWLSKQFSELEKNNENEVRQLVDNYFECELLDKDENLEKILEKYKYMMKEAFKIYTHPKMR